MASQPIIFFDSGVGGLTLLYETRFKIPNSSFIYIADDAAFPYGDWQENELCAHILNLFEKIFAKHNALICVIACNTASTLILPHLRQKFPNHKFVGTVPAIKPAAQKTYSKLISVLATPGTVKRNYTHSLIDSYARDCEVSLVGSSKLAQYAEEYLCGTKIDIQLIKKEIEPCFIKKGDKRTDIVVLACTHYPFLINLFRKVAPWPVDWLNPAEAIAHRTASLIAKEKIKNLTDTKLSNDIAYFTSNEIDPFKKRILEGFGLELRQFT